MTIEETKVLDIEQVEARSLELAGEIENADEARLDEIQTELEALEERKKAIVADVEARKQAAAAVISGEGTLIEEEGKKMPDVETRNKKEYIDAFAEYIKTGDDTECRALLTENVTGGAVPVPEFVESRIRRAWERSEILSRVAKSYVRGNLKIGFEIEATDAAIHTEGAAAPAEETLTLGIVTMVPQNIKKWITVSDEVLALGSSEFLAYIYDELAYKIVQKLEDEIIRVITEAPATSSETAVGVSKTQKGDASSPYTADIITAAASLGDSARNPVVIASGSMIGNIKAGVLLDNFNYDPFDGMTVIKKESLENTIIVGDLSGVQVNMPEGSGVTFKFDDLSLSERDLVKIVGRLYAAVAVVGPDMFAVILPPTTPGN